MNVCRGDKAESITRRFFNVIQLLRMGGNVTMIRGNLLRENFSLKVMVVNDEDEKLVWLADFLSNIPGNGLIST